VYKTIKAAAGKTSRFDTMTIAVWDGGELPKGRFNKEIKDAAARPECTGKPGAVAMSYLADGTRLMLVGLGAKDGDVGFALRTAGGIAVQRAAECEAKAMQVVMPNADDYGPFAEGVGLAAFVFDSFKKAEVSSTLALAADDAKARAAMKRGLAMAESANFSRMMSCTPPNVATPAWMAKQARALARKTGMKCEVFQGKALDDKKLYGIKTVGQASSNPPCLIKLTYQPTGTANQQPAVLLGKTLTYDSGGLSLKVNNGMRGMKNDKNGGCAVLGAMHAIATHLKPKKKIVALLAAAENSVSSNAYRPDDVINYMNGVSVEVTNTDAEGRLVLADGLAWACKHEKPACIVDMATLTGGVVVALGDACAGLWCDDDDLRAKLDRAAEKSGEKLWRLPLWQPYKDMMKSDVADIINSSPVRKAHPIQGAAFLAHFVDEGVPWAHIDIAGVSTVDAPVGPYAKGPTGFGARLVAEMLAG
jgi:leucyl aminopeptidase